MSQPQPCDIVRITGCARDAGRAGVVVPSPDPSFWEGNVWIEVGDGLGPHAYLARELTTIEAAAPATRRSGAGSANQ